jgi:hypothetical protein
MVMPLELGRGKLLVNKSQTANSVRAVAIFSRQGRVQKPAHTFGAKAPWRMKETSQVVFERLPRVTAVKDPRENPS